MKTSLPLFQNLIALPFSCVIWLFILPNQQYLPDDITPLQKTLIQHLTADSLKRYQILLSVQPNFISWGSEEPSVVRQHWGRKESPFNSDDPVISTSLEGLLKQLNEVLRHHALTVWHEIGLKELPSHNYNISLTLNKPAIQCLYLDNIREAAKYYRVIQQGWNM